MIFQGCKIFLQGVEFCGQEKCHLAAVDSLSLRPGKIYPPLTLGVKKNINIFPRCSSKPNFTFPPFSQGFVINTSHFIIYTKIFNQTLALNQHTFIKTLTIFERTF
jgi:hypothetical protein